MVVKEVLSEKFQLTGCDDLSEDILEKCIELCHWYNVDEEEFVDMWVAFGVMLDGNLEPTLKTLDEMKRKTPRSKNNDHVNSVNIISQPASWTENDDEDEILGMYTSSEKISSLKTKRPRSPDPEDKICKSHRSEFVPDHEQLATTASSQAEQQHTLSSQILSSQKSSQGSKIIASVGPKLSSWKNTDDHKFVVKLAGPHLPQNARYMFEVLKTTSDERTRVCRVIGFWMTQNWPLKKDDMSVTWNVRNRQQNSFRTWGRVCFDTEGKQSSQNSHTVFLEGCRRPPKTDNPDAKLWPLVELDVSELRECCLFPGQIIAVEGLNPSENLLKVEDIYTGNFLPMAKPPCLKNELKMIVASGPFTTQSSELDFNPLWDLMTQVAEEEPHILILIGPFLNWNHAKVQSDTLTMSYTEHFNRLVGKIKNYINGKCTQVLLVASSQDVHHHSVYPTPEYGISKILQSKEIHSLPDPCTLDLDGLRIGITAIDSFKHLAVEEAVMKQSGKDKFSRVANYILNQACFYPLYPAAKEVNIDTELWGKYAFMKEKPHLLILPSDMRYFCKYINETLVLNPERLYKRNYARINFNPSSGANWSQENISCEIVKM